jgi:predicted amidohydrolase
MERREFITAAVGSIAAISASGTEVKAMQHNIEKKDEKTKISLLQSSFVDGPVESNQFHPKFDVKALNAVYEKNIENIINLLEIAGKRGSDIACTTEDIKGLYPCLFNFDRPDLLMGALEKIPGKLSDRFAAIAKKYSMYIIACFYENDNGNIYNTATLFDRKGQIVGKYHKAQLPAPETWWLTPGNDLPVFETDFGNIAIQICYDMVFPEIVQTYALKGADIIFTPTAGYGWTEDLGASTAKVRAADNNVWIAIVKSACLHGAGRSSITNPLGQIISDAGYELNTVLTAYASPKENWVQPDFGAGTFITGVADMRARLNLERRPELYKTIVDKNPPILKRYPGVKLVSEKGKEAQKKIAARMVEQWKKEALDTDSKIGLNRTIL